MEKLSKIEKLAIDTIRTLSMDAVEKANSGHPGAPMALAPVAYVLWQEFLRFDPENPHWSNRDRFVLSNGHASMLLYSLLHLTGVKAVNAKYERTGELAVTLDDIKHFRQLGSHTPGHPEYGLVTGVETTTGPLGQGVANSVGMAIAERFLATRFNQKDLKPFEYDVYAICGDGDMMEGIASEAASVAGHLGLANLCWIYDSNHISIEGSTSLAFTENVAERFKAYGWHVEHVDDANDLEALRSAIKSFKAETKRPTMIVVHSHIGYGSPKQDKASAHGEPLGAEAIKAAKKFYGWPEDAQFLIPDEVKAHFQGGFAARGKSAYSSWTTLWRKYQEAHPELAKQFEAMQRYELPSGWDKDLPVFPPDAGGIATRDSSQKVLNALAKNVPWIVGGSADLAPSTKTLLTFDGAGHQSAEDPGGRNLHFGVREHSMGAIVNGLVLSKLRAYGATFLIFSDYEKPAIRLSALMEIPALHIFTHDSIGVCLEVQKQYDIE
jgi:transketolase